MIAPILIYKLQGRKRTTNALWFNNCRIVDDGFWEWLKTWFEMPFTDHTPNIADVRITHMTLKDMEYELSRSELKKAFKYGKKENTRNENKHYR